MSIVGGNELPTDKKIFHFPNGIPGFEEYHDFYLVEDDDAPLAQLIALDNEQIGFIVVDPKTFFPGFINDIELTYEEIELLKVEQERRLEVWIILTLNHQNMALTTANLRAPIILNADKCLGTQIILNDEKYLARQIIFPQTEIEEIKEGAVV